MRNVGITFAALAGALTLASPSVHAAKPTDANGVPFGNGFPSGPHFNLNLIGKKAGFTCPAAEFDEYGNQIYGNVIFVPREQNGDPITVLMESGTKGPKGAPQTAELQVTDWCAESFPDSGQTNGDGAVLRLPANANGYAVYGRITGKPGSDGEPTLSIVPGLFYVEDEAGNDLMLLGLVDSSGVATFASDGTILHRTSTTGSGGKGVQKATNLTGLFSWTGDVCYVQTDASGYCYDQNGAYICSTNELCCSDADSDGVYESCAQLANVGVPVDDGAGGTVLTCPADTTAVTAQCRSYENEWVFNISDFVGYLWDLDSTGAYNVNIRFYPIK